MTIGLYLLTEYVAAPLYLNAETQRQVVRSGKLNLLDSSGLWANDGRRFILVRNLRLGHIPEGVEVFNFDADGRLRTALSGREAEVSNTRKWTLINVLRKEQTDAGLVTTRQRQLDIGAFWSEQELPVLALSPIGMSPRDLTTILRTSTIPVNVLIVCAWCSGRNSPCP